MLVRAPLPLGRVCVAGACNKNVYSLWTEEQPPQQEEQRPEQLKLRICWLQ